MNWLSWLIYLASVVGSINVVVSVCLVLGLIAYAIVGAFFLLSDSPTIWSWDNKEDKLAKYQQRLGYAKTFLLRAPKYMVALALFAVVIPSQTTIYAIAASEAGETALKSETGSKAVKALNAWLDRQIADGEKTK